jgi:transposase
MCYKNYPSNLTDTEWQLIEPLLPPESRIGHPREVDLRAIINAIFYVQREGCTWRGLPGDFPPWQTVYNYLRHWQRLGVWQQIHDQLREQVRQAVGKNIQASAGVIDSQSVKTTEKRGRSTATTRRKKSKDGSGLPSLIPWDC